MQSKSGLQNNEHRKSMHRLTFDGQAVAEVFSEEAINAPLPYWTIYEYLKQYQYST